MSASLSAERDRIQRQVEELEQSLSATQAQLELLSSETDDESDGSDTDLAGAQSAAGLLAQRDKIQEEIQKLEKTLGPHSPICVSDNDSSSSSDESELSLPPSVDSCLQMNLVYQQVVQETLDQLEVLLKQNQRQQNEVMSQLSGSIKEGPRERGPPSSYEKSSNMFLGHFLKPYFKDKLTGLGPPANQEAKEKALRVTNCPDRKKFRVMRWESWQKTLLIHSIAEDTLKRLVQPKLSKIDYLSKKLSSAKEEDRQQLQQQIDSLEKEIDMLKMKKEEELTGERYDEHDWQKIANIDTGRTAFMCLQTFQRFISGSLKHRSWTPAEDALLKELVEKMRIGNFIPYTQMSYFMEGREPSQLIYRWNHVLDPSIKKGPWTKKEDELLLRAVAHYGEKDWWRIRLEVPGRTDSSCRDRYLDCLRADLKRTPFDKQEKELLLQLVEKHGVGHWAKIAAEIPHRSDAQCLREWKKLTRKLLGQTQHKPRKKADRPRQKVKRSIRKRLNRLKESTDEENETEDEETEVVYMDSDEEEKKVRKKEEIEEERTEKTEEEYTIPPLQMWIPVEKAQSSTSLSFRLVELPTSGINENERVRSTILGRHGRSVIIGPRPKDILWENRHSSRAMMMVSADQLRTYLSQQASKHKLLVSAPPGKPGASKQSHHSRETDTVLGYRNQVAVIAWVGNLLIPAKKRVTAADVLREQGEKRQISSTSVFLLFLQTMNVDAVGCKEVIEQRKRRVIVSTPTRSPDPLPVKPKKSRTVAEVLQQREKKKQLQEMDHQQYLILEQLQALQLQRQQQLLFKHLQQLQHAPLPNQPSIVLQMQPNRHPPMSFLQAVFAPPSVTQPHKASVQCLPPTSPNTRPWAPYRSPSDLQRMTVPPLTVVTTPPYAATPSFASFQQQTGALPPCPSAIVTQGFNSRCPVPGPCQPFPTPSESTLTRPKRMGQQKAEVQEAVMSNPSRVDIKGKDDVIIGECGGGNDASGIEDGKRIRKPSKKAKALQEASEAKAKTTKKPASSPRKRAHTKRKSSPPQEVCTVPVELLPQTPTSSLTTPITGETSSLSEVICSPVKKTEAAHPLTEEVPPVSENLTQDSHQASPNRSITSTDKAVLASPSSIQPSQHTASLISSVMDDHSYISLFPVPTPKRCRSRKSKKSPFTRKSKPRVTNPKKPLMIPPKKRKWACTEEQESMESSQDDQEVGSSSDAVGEKSDAVTVTGEALNGTDEPEKGKDDNQSRSHPDVVKEGKRTRKPSQKARALQESKEVKAEDKKKKALSSCKRRPRTSKFKEKAVAPKQPLTLVQGLCLNPGQPMLVMTPRGLVQLAGASPQCMNLPAPPSTLLSVLPRNTLQSQPSTAPLCSASPHPAGVSIPVNVPGLNQPCLPPALPTCPSNPPPPALMGQPTPNPGVPPLPSSPSHLNPNHIISSEGLLGQDKAASPSPRKEPMQFDPTLMFLESRGEVQDWLNGQGGVVVPGEGVTLPYLPPFVSSLSTLTALLRSKKSLSKLAMQLLNRESRSQPKPSQTTAKPDSCTKGTTSEPQDLPDSTSDLRPASPTVRSEPQEDQEEDEEIIAALRQLVAKRFSENPAYQLLKARFLSCFTLPALLATMQPDAEKMGAVSTTEEEDGGELEKDEEEEKLKIIKERAGKRKIQKSSLLCDGSQPSANRFSRMDIHTNTQDQILPLQSNEDHTYVR
ncbi:snRNA-activating protein complex subunit 4 isoform X2 [Cheilinus undulatus]|uniref:snRNA-activating protein complex subunit 4 isoform X2 n=1 Tax=Cheilinus undulatus TaxID=241271 RepID=UPI001BD1D58C|nr:snRNA-activating protein complex subunit 4 isoform X2 [Cheilinus undulatus]